MALRNKRVTYSERPTRAARVAHAKGDAQFRSYDVSAIQPKRKPWGKIVAGVVALVAVIIIAAVALTGCDDETVEVIAPGETATVTVKQGEGASSIASSLLAARVIPSTSSFMDEVNRRNATSSLLPGVYPFEGGMSVSQVVDALVAGPDYFAATLTIPEGTTREGTAEAVEKASDGRITQAQFMAATEDASDYVADYAFLKSVGTSNLEGFLFPKTYSLPTDATADSVVRMMLNQFAEETANLDWSYPNSHGLTVWEAVTLASIVEKEGLADNYAEVASVFYNRLAAGMPLQSDATTAYEVGHDPTAEEVHADTPYSTYSNHGLPPTAICSPGLATLQAVCNPADTDYLFFYFAPDSEGTMQYYFSKTYADHQDAIVSS